MKKKMKYPIRYFVVLALCAGIFLMVSGLRPKASVTFLTFGAPEVEAADLSEPSSSLKAPDRQSLLTQTPKTRIKAKLIGTAVVGNGRSIAFVEINGQTWLMHEGEEMVSGVRLHQIHPDGIVLERQGGGKESLLFELGSQKGDGKAVLAKNPLSFPVPPALARSLAARSEKIQEAMKWNRARFYPAPEQEQD